MSPGNLKIKRMFEQEATIKTETEIEQNKTGTVKSIRNTFEQMMDRTVRERTEGREREVREKRKERKQRKEQKKGISEGGGGLVDQRKWVESSGVKRKADKKIENEEGERINEQIKKLRRQEVGGKDLEWGEGRREKLREGGKIPLHGRAQDSETLRKVDRKLENCGRRFTERRGRGEGERENVRGGAKIILAEEPFYKKKCSEREKTTDNDKNVTESYRESKEE